MCQKDTVHTIRWHLFFDMLIMYLAKFWSLNIGHLFIQVESCLWLHLRTHSSFNDLCPGYSNLRRTNLCGGHHVVSSVSCGQLCLEFRVCSKLHTKATWILGQRRVFTSHLFPPLNVAPWWVFMWNQNYCFHFYYIITFIYIFFTPPCWRQSWLEALWFRVVSLSNYWEHCNRNSSVGTYLVWRVSGQRSSSLQPT